LMGTHDTDGVIVKAFKDANNDGNPEGGELGSATVANGLWNIEVTLAQGLSFIPINTDNRFVIVAQNDVGLSDYAKVPLIVEDSHTPTAPRSVRLRSDEVSNTGQYSVSGSADADIFIVAHSDVDGDVSSITTTSVNFEFSAVVVNSDGPHQLTFFAVDFAGNRSPASSAIAVTVDKTAPQLQNVDVSTPLNGTAFTEGETIRFTLAFDESIAVNAGVSQLQFQFSDQSRTATYDSHSGSSVSYIYVVKAGEEIESILSILTQTSIADLAGNAYLDTQVNL
jgi:hypothetical protein